VVFCPDNVPAYIGESKEDGVAKTRQLLRCCDGLAASTYVSTPHGSTIARLAFGAFCLAIPFVGFCENIKERQERVSFMLQKLPSHARRFLLVGA
jgi:hypothetical protein